MRRKNTALPTEYPYARIIRDLRIDHDLTQKDVALILGTSQTMVTRYETCKSEMPIHHLISLAQYYQVTSDYILGLENNKKKRFVTSK